MAQYLTLTATPRDEFGKGFARRLRTAGRIPGVIYSGTTENVHFSVDRIQFTAVIRNQGVNAIVELDIDGVRVVPGAVAMADRDGVFFLPAGDADAILARAAAVVAREETLHAALAGGRSLCEALGFSDAAP